MPERMHHRIVYPGLDPEDICATSQTHKLVSRHVNQLPPAVRAAFQLRLGRIFLSRGVSQAKYWQRRAESPDISGTTHAGGFTTINDALRPEPKEQKMIREENPPDLLIKLAFPGA
jgi:hypothetical protein